MAENKISPSEAQVGMIVSRPLTDKQGRVIINEGGRLTPAHIKRLEAWGITELFVTEAGEESSKQEESPTGQSENLIEQLDKDYINKMAIVFNERFEEVKDNSLMQRLKKQAFKVVVLAGKGGIPAIVENVEK